MADTKAGRERRARDEENRQGIGAMGEELERGDEPGPEDVLDDAEYPLSVDELRSEHADSGVETDRGSERLEDLLGPAPAESFDSPAEVRERLRELSE